MSNIPTATYTNINTHAPTVEIVVICDGCGTEARGKYTGETRTDRYAAARRWLTENKGWRITPQADLCAPCDTAHPSPPAPHPCCHAHGGPAPGR